MALGNLRVGSLPEGGDEQRRVKPGYENADLVRGALIDAQFPCYHDIVPCPAAASDDYEKPVPCGNLFKDRKIGLYPVVFQFRDQDRAAQRDNDRLHCTSFCTGCSYRVVLRKSRPCCAVRSVKATRSSRLPGDIWVRCISARTASTGDRLSSKWTMTRLRLMGKKIRGDDGLSPVEEITYA